MGTNVTDVVGTGEAKNIVKELVVADPSNIPLIYADQIAQVAAGPQVCKLFLTLEDGAPKDGKQTLRTSAMLVLPTASLVQFCKSFMDNMSRGADKMLEADNNFRKAVEGFKAKAPTSKK